MEDIFKFLGAIAIGSAAWAWLAKAVVSQILARNLEAHKTTLRLQSEQAIELLKADLAAANKREELLQASTREKVLETLGGVYTRLLSINDYATEFLNMREAEDDTGRDSAWDGFVEAVKDFDGFFRPRRIYLSASDAQMVAEFVHKARASTRKYARYRNRALKRGDGSYSDELFDAFDDYLNNGQAMLVRIAEVFRKQCGIYPGDGSANV